MRAATRLVRQNAGTEFAHSRGIRMVSDDNMPSISLCARLRRERERRQIALSSISANTKISASLFEALERGDVSRWPSGIFRRSFIRAYAVAIGLDPDTVAREFLEQFPDPLDPPAPAAPSFPPARYSLQRDRLPRRDPRSGSVRRNMPSCQIGANRPSLEVQARRFS